MSKTGTIGSKSVGEQLVEQAVTGTPLGAGVRGRAVCCTCKSDVIEGAPVTVYAYRLSDEARFSVARLYCAECNRREVEHASTGCEEYVLTARVVGVMDCAEQTGHPALGGVSVLDHSPADDGGRLR